MADELKATLTVRYTKESVSAKTPGATISLDVTGEGIQSGVQSIGTTAEALGKGDITTIGWIWLKNLNLINFVELSIDGGTNFFGKLEPGEETFLPIHTANIHAKADSASCSVQYMLIEE